MQHLEVSCAVRRLFKSLGFKGLICVRFNVKHATSNGLAQIRGENYTKLLTVVLRKFFS